MEVDLKIKEAKELLEDNGYAVVKLTKRQLEDCKQCEERSSNGDDMECAWCSCSICIVQ